MSDPPNYLELAEEARARPQRIAALRERLAQLERQLFEYDRAEADARQRGDIHLALDIRHGPENNRVLSEKNRVEGELIYLEQTEVPRACFVDEDDLKTRPVVSQRTLLSTLRMGERFLRKLCA